MAEYTRHVQVINIASFTCTQCHTNSTSTVLVPGTSDHFPVISQYRLLRREAPLPFHDCGNQQLRYVIIIQRLMLPDLLKTHTYGAYMCIAGTSVCMCVQHGWGYLYLQLLWLLVAAEPLQTRVATLLPNSKQCGKYCNTNSCQGNSYSLNSTSR